MYSDKIIIFPTKMVTMIRKSVLLIHCSQNIVMFFSKSGLLLLRLGKCFQNYDYQKSRKDSDDC